jgi:hypothetical protein
MVWLNDFFNNPKTKRLIYEYKKFKRWAENPSTMTKKEGSNKSEGIEFFKGQRIWENLEIKDQDETNPITKQKIEIKKFLEKYPPFKTFFYEILKTYIPIVNNREIKLILSSTETTPIIVFFESLINDFSSMEDTETKISGLPELASIFKLTTEVPPASGASGAPLGAVPAASGASGAPLGAVPAASGAPLGASGAPLGASGAPLGGSAASGAPLGAVPGAPLGAVPGATEVTGKVKFTLETPFIFVENKNTIYLLTDFIDGKVDRENPKGVECEQRRKNIVNNMGKIGKNLSDMFKKSEKSEKTEKIEKQVEKWNIKNSRYIYSLEKKERLEEEAEGDTIETELGDYEVTPTVEKVKEISVYKILNDSIAFLNGDIRLEITNIKASIDKYEKELKEYEDYLVSEVDWDGFFKSRIDKEIAEGNIIKRQRRTRIDELKKEESNRRIQQIRSKYLTPLLSLFDAEYEPTKKYIDLLSLIINHIDEDFLIQNKKIPKENHLLRPFGNESSDYYRSFLDIIKRFKSNANNAESIEIIERFYSFINNLRKQIDENYKLIEVRETKIISIYSKTDSMEVKKSEIAVLQGDILRINVTIFKYQLIISIINTLIHYLKKKVGITTGGKKVRRTQKKLGLLLKRKNKKTRKYFLRFYK